MKLLSIVALCVLICGGESVQVDTQYGEVIGLTTSVDTGRGVTEIHEFRGIPFAKDTSGPRRFRNPEAPDNWSTPFEAFAPRASCPQRIDPGWSVISEDCLHLDIYTPNALAGADTYPVMFWVHGGAYVFGANINYPGHFLATHDVVVVITNYRLGHLGFAYTGNDACPGNVGLWDQKMALEFVVNNIRNFGGDPNRITVFGESAGAGSTALLMVSPETKGSFQQAILESGAEENLWTVNRPESQPENYTYAMAEDVGCTSEDDYEMMECMRGKTWEELVSPVTTCAPGYICLGMAPVVDGPGGFLPKMPKDLREDGDIMTGPIMSGIMQDDGALFLPILAPGIFFDCCSRERFETILRRVPNFYSSRFDGEHTEEDVFQALDWNYSQWPHENVKENNRDALVRLVTDAIFGFPWDTQMKKHQNLADTYGFVFNYRSKNSTALEWQGVMHAMEIPYVFGFPLLQFNEHIRNASHLPSTYYNQEDIDYSLYIRELWTNFAKYGNPTDVEVEKPIGGETVWPKFDLVDYSVLHLSDDVIEPMGPYRQQDYAFGSEYIDFVAFGDKYVTPSTADQGGAGFVSDHLVSLIRLSMTQPQHVVEAKIDELVRQLNED